MSNQTCGDFLKKLAEEAQDLFDKEKFVPAACFAMNCGMWSHFFKSKVSFGNPFNNELYGWFNSGFDASKDALNMDEKLKNIFAKREKEQDALIAAEKAKAKKKVSIWQ